MNFVFMKIDSASLYQTLFDSLSKLKDRDRNRVEGGLALNPPPHRRRRRRRRSRPSSPSGESDLGCDHFGEDLGLYLLLICIMASFMHSPSLQSLKVHPVGRSFSSGRVYRTRILEKNTPCIVSACTPKLHKDLPLASPEVLDS